MPRRSCGGSAEAEESVPFTDSQPKSKPFGSAKHVTNSYYSAFQLSITKSAGTAAALSNLNSLRSVFKEQELQKDSLLG